MPPVFRPSQQRDALDQTHSLDRIQAPAATAAPQDAASYAVGSHDETTCRVVERRHVAEGFIVEIRGAEPEPACAFEDLEVRHYLACVMPPPGGADVPGGVQVANDMVFVPAGHSCQRRSQKSRGRHLCLLLQTDFVAALLPDEVVIRPLAPRTDLVSEKLRHLLDGIAAELEAPGFASDMLIRALGLAAVIELGRCLMASAHNVGATVTAEQRVVDLVRSHLQSGLDQPVSLETLAAECGIGVRHLSRIFRKVTGMTIGHCLAVARIEHAKRLLCGTSVMIKEVSWRCGFREQAAFTTAFRRATGLSPSAFRCAPRDTAMPAQ